MSSSTQNGIEPKIAFHKDRKALLAPLMKRAELVMADYEEWITSGGTSIVPSPMALAVGRPEVDSAAPDGEPTAAQAPEGR